MLLKGIKKGVYFTLVIGVQFYIYYCHPGAYCVNLPPKTHWGMDVFGYHFPNSIFKGIFFNENHCENNNKTMCTILRLPQCQGSNPEDKGYMPYMIINPGKIEHISIITTKLQVQTEQTLMSWPCQNCSFIMALYPIPIIQWDNREAFGPSD